MSKYTEDAREHARINANCRKYRQTHRAQYNAKTRARRHAKIENMTPEQLAEYRAKRRQEAREYRARKKAKAREQSN